MNASRLVSRAALLALLTAAPVLGFAHVGADAGRHHGAMAAWAAGFVHPFGGADHLAAMLALGLWSALGARRVWLVPLAFAATLALGAALGVAGVELPGVEPMIAASLLALGLLLCASAKLPETIGAALAALFALFHGAAHGQAFAASNAWFAIGGMLLASLLLHAAGIALGLALRPRAGWLPRLAGAALALFGATLLGQFA